MIIANGYIELAQIVAGGIAEDGYATSAAVTWGSPIPCQYYANNRNNLGRSNGEAFVVASYTILIEQMDNVGERLRLTDKSGAVVGEYSVISTTPLDCVCQTKILV